MAGRPMDNPNVNLTPQRRKTILSIVSQIQCSREVIMRMRAVSPFFLALLVGIAALPAAACELQQAEHFSPRTATAFLAQHDPAVKFTPLRQLVACKPEGGTCTSDADCCSGACKPLAEGRACVSK